MDNYAALYEAAASLIPQESKIVEFGCGTGKFITNHVAADKIKSYIGYDKDVTAIDLARTSTESQLMEFVVADILTVDCDEPGCTFIALEVLEHLHNNLDLRLLGELPKGSRVIISVPSFDSSDHKKFFNNDWDALKRYSYVLDLEFWRKIRIPTGGGFFHLMRGYR